MDAEIIFIIFASIAAASSGSIVVTGLVFPQEMLDQTRLFSHILFFISFTDMIASIALAFGFPQDGTTLCSSQGFLIAWAFPASWLWTLLLVYQLRSAMIYRRLFLGLAQMHGIVWTASFLVALLPLSTNPYGQDDIGDGHNPCNYSGKPVTAMAWVLSDFYGVLLLCFLLMTSFAIHMIIHHFHTKSDSCLRKTHELIFSTFLYPLGMVIVWFPIMVYTFVAQTYVLDEFVDQVLQILSTQYGTFLAIIFFWKAKDHRRRWSRKLGFGSDVHPPENEAQIDISIRTIIEKDLNSTPLLEYSSESTF